MKHITQQIEKGLFKNHYLIYTRKSTDEPENQKNSLHYQKNEILRFAQNQHILIAPVTLEGFCIDGIISEKHSAFKEDELMVVSDNGMVQFKVERPKFYKLIQLLNKKLFKGVIMLCWDRASRNASDEAILKKLIKNECDIRFALTTYDKSSSGALHMDIDGMFAQHHSRVTSEKVKLNNRTQRAKGLCTYKAPVGYQNIGTMNNKPFDPIRAPLIKEMFIKYETSLYSLDTLTRWAIQQGFTMAPMRRKRTKQEKVQEEIDDTLIDIPVRASIPTKSSIHKILSNPFYVGKVKGNNGEYVTSNSHQALIDEYTFNRVQELLHKKNRSLKYNTIAAHPFRGFLRCGDCKRLYTPYVKKGIHYYGLHCTQQCTNSRKSMNENFIVTHTQNILKKFVLSSDELKELNTKAHTEISLIEQEQDTLKKESLRQKNKIEENRKYLEANKLDLLATNVYTPESYQKQVEILENDLVAINEKIIQTGEKIQTVLKDTIFLSELLKDLTAYEFLANTYEKEQIYKTIFSELEFLNKTLIYKCKKEFEVFEKRIVLSCAQRSWITELPSMSLSIKNGINILQSILQKIDNKR